MEATNMKRITGPRKEGETKAGMEDRTQSMRPPECWFRKNGTACRGLWTNNVRFQLCSDCQADVLGLGLRVKSRTKDK